MSGLGEFIISPTSWASLGGTSPSLLFLSLVSEIASSCRHGMFCSGKADYLRLAGKASSSQQGCGLPSGGWGGSSVLQCLAEGRRVSALPLSFLMLVFHFLFPLSDLWYLMIRCHGGQAQLRRSTGSFQGQWEGRTTKPAFTQFTLGQTLPNPA